MKKYFVAWLALAALLLSGVVAAAESNVDELRQEWEAISVAADKDKRDRLKNLAAQAEALAKAHPNDAEVLAWQGIITAGYARELSGLSALSNAKEARAVLERAIEIDPEGYNASAYVTLGVLYARAPGWPVGFGDKKKAEEIFKKALSIRSEGADVNGYYAEFLAEQKRNDEAKKYAQKAANAEPREGRDNSDGILIDNAKALVLQLN